MNRVGGPDKTKLSLPTRTSDGEIESYALVTTEAGPDVAPYDSRQPIILEPGDYAGWMAGGALPDAVVKPSVQNVETAASGRVPGTITSAVDLDKVPGLHAWLPSASATASSSIRTAPARSPCVQRSITSRAVASRAGAAAMRRALASCSMHGLSSLVSATLASQEWISKAGISVSVCDR